MASRSEKPARLGGEVEGPALIVEGRTRLKKRRASPQTISDEQIETFFATLADTCNVVRSAKAAGFAANWAYRKRKTDAAFRAGWARAVAEGYAKLEIVLLDRAMNGRIKRVRAGAEVRLQYYFAGPEGFRRSFVPALRNHIRSLRLRII